MRKYEKHGMTKTRFYRIYQGIKNRCNNSNDVDYHHYGGRGIKNKWGCFADFKNDMIETYKDNLEIDRIDNNGDYSKDNCRWANRSQQCRNRRLTKMYEYRGEKKCFLDWCDELNISHTLVSSRLKDGWGFAKAIKTPKLKPGESTSKLITCHGKTLSIRGWGKELGVPHITISRRLNRLPKEEALSAKDIGPNMYSFKGESRSLTEWSKKTGIKRDTLSSRIKIRGWSIEKALTTKIIN